jgi:chromosome segregation ATPase
MELQLQEVITKLQNLEEKIKTGEAETKESVKELNETMNDLQRWVVALDKDVAIQEEKRRHLILQISQLEAQAAEIEKSQSEGVSKRNAFAEQVVLLLIGSAIGAIASYVTAK